MSIVEILRRRINNNFSRRHRGAGYYFYGNEPFGTFGLLLMNYYLFIIYVEQNLIRYKENLHI